MKIIYTPERKKSSAKIVLPESHNVLCVSIPSHTYNATFLKVPDYNISYSKKIGDVVKGFFIAQSLPTISFEKSKQTVKIEFMSSEEYHAIVFKEKFSPDIPYTPPIASIDLIDVVDISSIGATINVSIVTKTGIELDTDPSFSNPIRFEIDGAANSVDVSGLEMDTQYYVRGYIVKDGSTIYSNNVLEFRTLEIIPTISLVDITDITDTTANVNVTIADGEDVSKTGVEIDTDPLFSNPTAYEENGAVNTIAVDTLTAETTYYVRAYVIWNGQTIYSANSLNFTTESGSILPAELQACEYLETDGNAYIITNANVNNITNLKIKCYQNTTVTSGSSVYGCGITTGNNASMFQLFIQNSKWAIRAFSMTNIISNTNSNNLLNLEIDLTNSQAIFNGSITSITNLYTQIISYRLFTLFGSRQQEGTYINTHNVRIYNCETNLFNLIPCYIKAGKTFTDNKGNTCPAGTPGMYDIVNNIFYTNDGTGTFSKGADINI